MLRFFLARIANYCALLVIASFLSFSLASLTFTPLDDLLHRNPRPPQTVIDARAQQLGLTTPIPLRYGHWVKHALHGDFGPTITGEPVKEELWRRIGVSLRLLTTGFLFGSITGVGLGAWSAIRQYHLSDRVITACSLAILSIPTFVLANLIILAALHINWALHLLVFDYTGETSPLVSGGWWAHGCDRLKHLVLPSLTLGLGTAAVFSRYQRNAMLDVLGQDFIRTARAKGLTLRKAFLKHGLRTALIPMVTLFAYGISGLVTGAVFVEKVFGWHGMGEWMIQGIATQDTNIVVTITVFSGIAVLAAGLISDICYVLLDPRVRLL